MEFGCHCEEFNLNYKIKGKPNCRIDACQLVDLSQEARSTCSTYLVDAEFCSSISLILRL
jgi:hypothetical protein